MKPQPKRQLALITLILLCGFALRVFRINAQPYSGDEAFTIINWARQPISLLLTQIALIDPQPPGTLLSIYGWTHLVGESELAARMLPAFFSTVALAATYAIAKYLFPGRTPPTALLLLAINPYHIWHAQDLRSYSLWMGLSSLSMLLLLKSTKQPSKAKWWLAYTLIQTVSLYTFYLEAFTLAAYHLFVLSQLRKKPQLLKPWLISQGSIVLLAAPWFLQPALRSSGYSPTAGPVNLPEAFSTLIYGETIPQVLNHPLLTLATNTLTPAALLAIGLIGAGAFLLTRCHNRPARDLLLATAFGPITLLATLTAITQQGYFRARYVSASLIPLIIIIAYLISQITERPSIRLPIRASLASLTILIYTIPAFSSVWTYHTTQHKSPPWREIAAFLHNSTIPDDIIIRNYPDPAFEYYVSPPANAIILPREPNTPLDETSHDVERLLATYDSLWFIPVSSPAYDPQQNVAQALDNQAQPLTRHWFGPTQILQYADWQVKPGEIAHPQDTQFSDIAALRGYRVYPSTASLKPGDELTITLYWEPHLQTQDALVIRVHLLGPPVTEEGQTIRARDDGPPLNGNLSTLNWPAGELIRDVRQFAIPSNVLPGRYTIAVGLHNPQAGENILTQTGEEQTQIITFDLALPDAD